MNQKPNDQRFPQTIIGIDLGTTNSCVGVWDETTHKVRILANGEGSRTTPSFVSFVSSERLVGDAAKNQAALNPKNTIFDAKRIIGRKFSEPTVQRDIAGWPFSVAAGDHDQPLIQIDTALCPSAKGHYTPEEISAMVLSRMKEIAEMHLGYPIREAVVTVPAYFSDSQRQATKDAGAIAGLTVRRIINEPTAAAIAYGLNRKRSASGSDEAKKATSGSPERIILIFDLGGGTFDCSLLGVENGFFEVRATAGDTHLGGEDFDFRLISHAMKEFQRTSGYDISASSRSMRRLRTACERAKRELSFRASTTIEVANLFQGLDFQMQITRVRFEELCVDLFRSCMVPVERVLRDANIARHEIDDVVLIGGSTRIPKIQQLLSDYFDGKDLCTSINPDEAVAYGAAIQGAIIQGIESEDLMETLLLDVTPLSLGLETAGGQMTVIIPRNSTIPVKKKRMFTTNDDDQDSVLVQVYEGERTLTRDNNLLGKFELKGIPLLPRSVPIIEVSFALDSDGILRVTAKETSTGNETDIVIQNNKGRLSHEEINKLILQADLHRKDDLALKSRLDAKNDLETYVYTLRNLLEDSAFKVRLTSEEFDVVLAAIHKALSWLENNQFADRLEYVHQHEQLANLTRELAIDDPVLSFATSQGTAPASLQLSDDDRYSVCKPNFANLPSLDIEQLD